MNRPKQVPAFNAALRFSLEIAVLVSLAAWGWHIDGSLIARMCGAVVVPLVVAAVWAIWVAPGSRRRLRDPQRLIVEVAVFAMAGASLIGMGHPMLAVVFVAAAMLNLGLLTAGSQR